MGSGPAIKEEFGPAGHKGSGRGKGKGKGAVPLGDANAGSGPGAEGGGAPGAGGADKGPEILEIGSLVSCRYRDGNLYPARVIERRPLQDPDDPERFEYYVHYRKFNRRMDEWVGLSNFDLSTLVRPEPVDPLDRSKRRKVEEEHSEEEGEGHEDFDPQQLREHEEFTKVKNIETIELGRHRMETWYFSPFPPEYRDCKTMYFCEHDLAFFRTRAEMLRHASKCHLLHPPGAEVYRSGNVSVFEVDGRRAKRYCQNLCYLAKLFLDHKTLYYDVDLFLFYVLCETDERGTHLVGYFSKEKASEEGFNLACILTLPAYQRKGYGKFLIAFSYELSRIEGRVGTPERPLSDLGLVSYRGYWTRILLQILCERDGAISIAELSSVTMFKPDDIISTLQHAGLIQYQKGQHVLCAAPHVLRARLAAAGPPGLEVDATKLIFTPYNAERDYGRG